MILSRAATAAFVCVVHLVLGPCCGAQSRGLAAAAPIWDLLPDRPADTRAAAFRAVAERRDARDLAPLGDLLRHAQTAEEWFAVLDALQPFFERNLRLQSGVWNLVTRRVAERLASEVDPLPQYEDYARWKGELLAMTVDPEMRRFFPRGGATRIRLEEAVWGGVEVDGIPSLDDPKPIAAADAELDPREPVFGLAWSGVARAYPLRVLDWHEMANDRLGDVPFALAYCTLCGAAVAFRTSHRDTKGEQVFRFGSSGLLMRSNKLMFDRGTDSLWNQLTGEPVAGELAHSGIRLDVLPVVLTTWGDWRRRHPETTTVGSDTGFNRRYELGAAYGRYFADPGVMFPARSSREGGCGPRLGDERPRHKEQLFVVRDGGRWLTVRRSEIERDGIVHRRLDSERVVLIGARAPLRDLPATWRDALASAGGGPERFDQLEAAATVAMLRVPERFAELDAERMLAMPVRVRFAVLQEFAPERERDLRLDPRLRDEVAVRALVAPIRAYTAGERTFRRVDAETLRDGDGQRWTVTEEALRRPDGAPLRRLPGHLVFGLGWRAFLSDR